MKKMTVKQQHTVNGGGLLNGKWYYCKRCKKTFIYWISGALHATFTCPYR